MRVDILILDKGEAVAALDIPETNIAVNQDGSIVVSFDADRLIEAAHTIEAERAGTPDTADATSQTSND